MRGIIPSRRPGIIVIALSAAMTACGQTGALYLPEAPPVEAAEPPVSEEADED